MPDETTRTAADEGAEQDEEAPAASMDAERHVDGTGADETGADETGADETGADDPDAMQNAAAAIDEARRRIAEVPPEVVITNHVMGLYELAAIHLSAPEPDLAAAALAIDAVASLVDGLGDRLGADDAGDARRAGQHPPGVRQRQAPGDGARRRRRAHDRLTDLLDGPIWAPISSGPDTICSRPDLGTDLLRARHDSCPGPGRRHGRNRPSGARRTRPSRTTTPSARSRADCLRTA